MKRYKQAFMVSGAFVIFTGAGIAQAQAQDSARTAVPQSAAAAATAETGSSLGEILVTARKRQESLQSTPIAISAFNAATLEARGTTNLSQLSNSTPSLTFNTSAPQSGNPSATSVFIRGVGQLDFTIFTDPGVGIYIDGVYVARSVGAALDFLDIDRVEVLRGPQGTLFGRNTIGGAISVSSKLPAETLSGDISATTGRFNRASIGGNLSIPLNDKLFFKVSAFGNFRDGYAYRAIQNQRLGNDHAIAGSAQLLWKPTSTFTSRLIVDATDKREAPYAGVALKLAGFGFSATGVAFTTPQANPATAFNLKIGGICATNPDSSRLCFGNAWATGNPYVDNGTFGDHTNLNIFGASLTNTLEFGSASLKSITAYRKMSARYFRDTDHSPLTFLQIDFNDHQHQFSQEFQLIGSAFDRRLHYLVGAYYFTEKGNEAYDNFNAVSFDGVATVATNNRSIALFTENTFDVTQWLHLTAGVRYTNERKKFSIFYPVTQDFNLAAPPALGSLIVADSSQKSVTFKETNPRFTISIDPVKSVMIYGTYSEGFKSGGFNGRYSAPVPAPISFNPESVKQYEAGLKFQQGILRANFAVFHDVYSNIQINYRPNPALVLTVIGNAAQARINGAEAEVSVVPVKGLRFDAGGSYLDARYTKLDPGLVAAHITLATPFALTPKWQENASATYELNLHGSGTLSPRIDWSHRSLVFNDNTGSLPIAQPGYSLVNVSLTFQNDKKDIRVSAGVTNVGKTKYLVSGAFSGPAGVAEGVYGRPQEWFLSVKKAF